MTTEQLFGGQTQDTFEHRLSSSRCIEQGIYRVILLLVQPSSLHCFAVQGPL